MEYSLIYLNVDNRWRVEINDKTVFITHQALERLFGKGCVIRPLDLTIDVAGENEPVPHPQNVFMPHLLDHEKETVVIQVNPAIQGALINGMLIPTHTGDFKLKGRLRFCDSPPVSTI
jgi:hypothetical protein